MISPDDSGQPAPEDEKSRAAPLMERLHREVSKPEPDWELVRSCARRLAAEREAWLAHAEELRDFATRVYDECQLRFGTQPWCLPVLGAAGDETDMTVRGLIHSPGATQVYAEECLVGADGRAVRSAAAALRSARRCSRLVHQPVATGELATASPTSRSSASQPTRERGPWGCPFSAAGRPAMIPLASQRRSSSASRCSPLASGNSICSVLAGRCTR